MNGFSENLKRLRKERGLSLDSLANEINKKFGEQGAKISKGMLSKYENGKEANLTNANFIASYFGVSLNELLGLVVKEEQEVYRVKKNIPVIGTIAAGTPIFAEQNILGYAPAPPLMNVDNKNVFYLKVKGESMNKEFPNGSFVLINRDVQVENGEIAAVLVNGDEATVKKIFQQDHYLTLMPLSNDESFNPEIIDLRKEEVTIIGKVIGSFKQY